MQARTRFRYIYSQGTVQTVNWLSYLRVLYASDSNCDRVRTLSFSLGLLSVRASAPTAQCMGGTKCRVVEKKSDTLVIKSNKEGTEEESTKFFRKFVNS